MLNRRSFICSSLAAGLGLHKLCPIPATGAPVSESCYAPNEFKRAVAEYDPSGWLGRPRSRALVRQGFHPISPDRAVVMTEKGGDGLCGRHRSVELAVRETLGDPATLHHSCAARMEANSVAADNGNPTRCPACGYPWSVTPADVSEAKLELIFRVMRTMTGYYRVPRLFPKWATGLAKREALGSVAMGGFGLVHQFQDNGLVHLVNAPVDWWLFLFPDGIAWTAGDDEPVFGMLGHVFPPDHPERPGFAIPVYALSSTLSYTRQAGSWKRITRLDRMAAARAVNRAIFEVLKT